MLSWGLLPTMRIQAVTKCEKSISAFCTHTTPTEHGNKINEHVRVLADKLAFNVYGKRKRFGMLA